LKGGIYGLFGATIQAFAVESEVSHRKSQLVQPVQNLRLSWWWSIKL